jgi:hypothetical protein
METSESNAAAGRRKTVRLMTALSTGVLLVAVAAMVTHNPVHPPASAAALVVQGDPINQPTPAATVTASATVAEAPKVAATAAAAGYAEIGFDRLAGFPLRTKWEMTDPVRIKGEQRVVGEIPDSIKALDRNKIAVTGFMLPVKMSGGLVSDFFLLRTQARCCYGLPIQVNELLTVHMTGTGVKSLMDQPITVYGTFHLAETRDTSTGTLDGVYTLDGDKLEMRAL